MNSSSKSPNTACSRSDRHFASYTAATGAALALAGSQPAEAAITYVVPGAPISIPATLSGVYLNLETGIFGITTGSAPGWDVNPWSSTSFQWYTTAVEGGSIASSAVSGGQVQSIAALTDLSTLTYDPSPYLLTSSPAFFAGGNHFVALTFLNGAAAPQRAWLEVTTTAVANARPATINRWAYSPLAETLLAGQTGAAVPEASTVGAAGVLGLLAVGAVGLRRRRAA